MITSEKLRKILTQALELPAHERSVLVAALSSKRSDSALRGSWAKLDHARIHRESLEADIQEYFSDPRNGANLYAELDQSDGTYVFRIASLPDYTLFLERASLRIGDAANNLRAALDHAVCQLACRALGQPAEALSFRHSFPIHDDRTTYAREVPRALQGLSDKQKTVVESFQPYHGEGQRPDSWEGPWIHPFKQLQAINNFDKHRGLLVACVLQTGVAFNLPVGVHLVMPNAPLTTAAFERYNPFRDTDGRLELGAEVCRWHLGGVRGARLDSCGTATPGVKMADQRCPSTVLKRIEYHVECFLTELDISLR